MADDAPKMPGALGTPQPAERRYRPGGEVQEPAGSAALHAERRALCRRADPDLRGAPRRRTFDDTQILYFQLEDGKVRSVDQSIGDPPAVTEFWA